MPPEDPAALADAIARLAKDPALAAASGATRVAVTVAEHFDGDELARRMAGLFAGASRHDRPVMTRPAVGRWPQPQPVSA